VDQQVVHEHLQIREGNHERSGRLCDRGSPQRGRPVVDRERTVGRAVLGDARRILAAPCVGVSPGELAQLIWERGVPFVRELSVEHLRKPFQGDLVSLVCSAAVVARILPVLVRDSRLGEMMLSSR
jgi:hypothetical protein